MVDILDAYPKWVKPGAVFSRTFDNPANPNNLNRVEVRAIVDGHLILRSFSRRKGWRYWVEDIIWFSFNLPHIQKKRG